MESVDSLQCGCDRTDYGAGQLVRCLLGVDGVQSGHRIAELSYDPIADAVLLHEAQQSSGHGFARDGGAYEKRPAEDGRIGAHVMHVGDGHPRRLGKATDTDFAVDAHQLDRNARNHRQRQSSGLARA